MAVFVSASDERSSGGNRRNRFFYGGFLAPEKDWYGPFAEQWNKDVLKGPPRIPWLHMTDIRSKKWREQEKITRAQGEQRVKAAFELISEMPSLTPIGSALNAGQLLDTFITKVQFRKGGKRKFEPDYLAFMAYAYLVLMFCDKARPDAEKVDFVVERNNDITKRIQEFYDDMPDALTKVGLGRLVPLLGELIPAGKERIPLQAADLLCWHTERFREGTLDDKNVRRYKVIATRRGARSTISDSAITELWTAVVGKS